MSNPVDLQASADARADAAAIARVLAGDAQAFAELVHRYQGLLYRHAVGMVLDHDEAADMVQDAFVRAYRALPDCRDATRFRAWIFQTLRNRCRDHLKDVRRRNVRLEDAAEPMTDPADGPGTGVEHARLRGDIERAVRALPELLREAFVLHHIKGMPYEAMATLLGASVSALKMRVARAREQLSTALRETHVTSDAAIRLSIRRG